MPYTVLDPARMMRITGRAKTRKSPLKHTAGVILITSSTDIYKIPANCTLQKREDVWELHLPKDYNKSLKQLAKQLDAIAFM